MTTRRNPPRRMGKKDEGPTLPSQTAESESPEQDPNAMWDALQQSIGNAAVGRMQSVQQQAQDEDATPVDDTTQSAISASHGRGTPLPEEAQQELSPSFRASRSGVRVHTDAAAGAMARGLGARAFTQGRDIFFAPGEYDTASVRGKVTLAHELTHALHGREQTGVVHCLGDDIPMPFAPGQRYADEGPQMSLADPGGEVSTAAEYGASQAGDTREMVGGVEYVANSAFEWALGGNVLDITVPIAFTGESPNPAWFKEIRKTWNHFDIVNSQTGERVMLIFDPIEGSTGYPVQVLQGDGRSNEGQWYLGDTRTTTAPHEFGHLLGLQDEYQVTKEHYEGVTGEDAPEGEWLGAKGTLDEIADAMHKEVIDTTSADQPGRLLKVTQDYKLRNQGTFNQSIADVYKQKYKSDLVADLAALQATVTDDKGYIYWVIERFSYSSGSIMGNAELNTKSIDHEHGVQPRHVRRFAQLVAAAYGGNWRPEFAR